MEHDLHHRVKGVIALKGGPINTGGIPIKTFGVPIDTLGFEGLEYFITATVNNEGTSDFVLEESDDIAFGFATTVGPDEIVGSTIGFMGTIEEDLKRIGSLGKKRFQRFSILSNFQTDPGISFISVLAVLGHAYVNPVTDVLEAF